MEYDIRNEHSMLAYLGNRIEDIFPGLLSCRLQVPFPDLTIVTEEKRVEYYEIEYKLLNFFRHRHDQSSHPCHGIIYWIDDRDDSPLYNTEICTALKLYRLIGLQPKEGVTNWERIPIYTELLEMGKIDLQLKSSIKKEQRKLLKVKKELFQLEIRIQEIYRDVDPQKPYIVTAEHDMWKNNKKMMYEDYPKIVA